MSSKEAELLTRRPLFKNQLTIQRSFEMLDQDIEKDHSQLLDRSYENDLLKTLIESEKDKINFQNTKNSVSISNSYRPNSKMCCLM